MAQTDQLTDQPSAETPGGRPSRPAWVVPVVLAVSLVVVAGAVVAALSASRRGTVSTALVDNPVLDPGTPVNRPATNFTLTDEFGRPVSLRSFRGKVVILAFNDSECTTICPLTTTAMVDAQRSLGPAGSKVQLLGVDANPDATSTHDVLSYSQLHGLIGRWHFLTGALPQLKAVWKSYGIAVSVERGQIDHTPALFMIDPSGRLRRVYLTQASYAAIPQLGQLLAQEASELLPGHPRVDSHYSYAHITGIAPTRQDSLPAAGGGKIRLGPGAPHLYLFFATWDRQVTDLSKQLELLGRYPGSGQAGALPLLTAIDEASVEPSPGRLDAFLRTLPHRLSYPVGIDRSGLVADGYEVQDQPWLVLTSASGRIVWYHDVSTSGWPTVPALSKQVRAALSRAPTAPAAGGAAQQALVGSPPALAALHRQAGRIVGSSSSLDARVRALRGYPIVVNVWASWCGPCQAEFGLLASASARYGRQVAFLGADVNDSTGDAQAFLRQHPVSYPSYEMPLSALQSLLPQGVVGLPTTFFIDPAGKVVFVHTGQYDSQGTLDQDIESHGLAG